MTARYAHVTNGMVMRALNDIVYGALPQAIACLTLLPTSKPALAYLRHRRVYATV